MEPLEIQTDLVIPAADLSMSTSRSSGPGGQHVNKVATRVELRFALSTTTALGDEVRARLATLAGYRLNADGDIVIAGQRYRSQVRNLEDCRERLRLLILRALRPPRPRRRTRPTAASVRKRLADKAHQSRKKRNRRSDLDD